MIFLACRLHLHNINLLQQSKKNETRITGTTLDVVKEFGFHTPTCCGFIPLDNTGATDWVVSKDVSLILNFSTKFTLPVITEDSALAFLLNFKGQIDSEVQILLCYLQLISNRQLHAQG